MKPIASTCSPVTSSPAPMALFDNQDILDNIDGHMHGPTSGFVRKYFGAFQYIHQDSLLEIQRAGRVIGRCAIPAAPPSDNVLEWFSNLLSREFEGARGSWHITYGKGGVEHENTDGYARLQLVLPTSSGAFIETKWDCTQVIGQFVSHRSVDYREGLLQLCRSAFNVFASQPTRLFLHGFYIRGPFVELCVFDRSGLYFSDVLDGRKDSNQIMSFILSYQLMTNRDLGNSNIIQMDEGGSYILCSNTAASSLGKLYLESQPIASSHDIVGTGTVCYRAKRPEANEWNYVLKLKWRWTRDRSEEEFLSLAKTKCAWGAVSLDFYKEVESTADLRSGLRWDVQRKFSEAQFHTEPGRDEDIRQRDHVDGLCEHTEHTNNQFLNRILTCAVTSPVGRPLQTFQSPLELLQVFHDAIKCHRSLFSAAKLLHQDISSGNIVILDSQREEDPKGILIDLDSARDLTDDLETRQIIGTRPFMAIGVLRNECHTYRHDLESFLYVFLWTIITNHADSPPKASKLRQWSKGGWDELALCKLHDMDQSFQSILQEFPPEFHSIKPLAELLRQILFPPRAGVMWTGTDNSAEAVDMLYNGIIDAFSNAIVSERGSQM
ncbi:hypothetical protein E4U13_003626 [Claviceps humidiphila]|uniref:Fungal-type protein kinase domain-containing protein n=1 Tax=Claviceps humidiphila TaxID=1294629 RepID=A0A9P7TTN2_9HYPO|nr:hypothetical protein E4U13_003626 [Claviceps humidiphila]